MANVTSASKIHQPPPVWLAALCAALKRDFPVEAIPARVTGKRWGCFNGSEEATRSELPLTPPERIEVAPGLGVLVYGWFELSEIQRDVLIKCIGHQILEGDDNE